MSGTAGALRLIEHGFAALPVSPVQLQTTASGTWVNTGLQVTLPAAGVYQLDATVRSVLTGSSPVNTYVVARLWDVAAAAVVPDSEALVQQIDLAASGGVVVSSGHNNTGAIQVEYAAAGPRAIRLEAARFNATGASTAARIQSDGVGRTTLRFVRVA